MGSQSFRQAGFIKNKNQMKKISLIFLSLMLITFSGCGYSTHSANMGPFRTISIEPFKNKITYGTDDAARNTYLPLLEVKITNAVADRFLFDGNLRPLK